VKTQKATTLLPFLATTDFNEQEQSHVSEFLSPVPYRSIGLVVHRHFVKKKLLIALQQEIEAKVKPLLPKASLKGNPLQPV
jgi:LysR family hydrogen peroxide-inducible transcriptional activator